MTSDLVSRNWCISPIFFEIGIPNLVCKCILGCLSVTNYFWVTVTLTSDLVFKNYCVQSISAILFDVGIPNFGWWFLLGWQSGAYHFESLWLWHWLLASFLGFSCYITAIFPQMCLMLDQFLWGHLSHVCDISCLYWVSIWKQISNEFGLCFSWLFLFTFGFTFRKHNCNISIPEIAISNLFRKSSNHQRCIRVSYMILFHCPKAFWPMLRHCYCKARRMS